MKQHHRIFTRLFPLITCFALLSITACDPGGGGGGGGNDSTKTNQDSLRTLTVQPQTNDEAPYEYTGTPVAEPEHRDYPPVPDGPVRGNMQPTARETKFADAGVQSESSGKTQNIKFLQYTDLTSLGGSLCCPEPSVAENGQTVMYTVNTMMTLSTDGGATFPTQRDPRTLFPMADNGMCCDQMLVYVPEHDIFVWLMQYSKDANTDNRIRIAVQTTDIVRSSNGGAWTYYDFVSDWFDPDVSLDRNDMTFGANNLWWATNVDGRGRMVMRIPLSQLAAKGTINCSYTNNHDDCYHAGLSQGGSNTVYWAGHVNNSEMRVYSMKDGEGTYSWRTVEVDSWPNQNCSAICPDNVDFMEDFNFIHYPYGAAVVGKDVWFAWRASDGGGFPQAHIQMARINTGNWQKEEQVQVWNGEVGFIRPYLSPNSVGELGMSIGFGGGSAYATHSVGVWGDFVVYYARQSTRCTKRWGDYTTVYRSGSNGREWVAAGYSMDTDAGGANIMRPEYIRFGR